MKLLRYGHSGSEKPGLLDDQGRIRDLSSMMGDGISKLGKQRQKVAPYSARRA
ncbi:MAG TPA: hypothetical protein VGL87_02580 [Steroidobacteraceae bacterium]|jgi:hypothetical protein